MKKLYTLILILTVVFKQLNAQDKILSEQEIAFKEIDSLLNPPDTVFYPPDTVYAKGKNYFSLGYGFITDQLLHFDLINDEHNMIGEIAGPFYLKYDHRLTKAFSMGISLAYLHQHYSMNYDSFFSLNNRYEITHQSFSALLRFNGHIQATKRLDFYGGIGIGYEWVEVNENRGVFFYWDPPFRLFYPQRNALTILRSDLDLNWELGLEATFGIKYLFTPHFGAYVETGFTTSLIQFGMVYKI